MLAEGGSPVSCWVSCRGCWCEAMGCTCIGRAIERIRGNPGNAAPAGRDQHAHARLGVCGAVSVVPKLRVKSTHLWTSHRQLPPFGPQKSSVLGPRTPGGETPFRFSAGLPPEALENLVRQQQAARVLGFRARAFANALQLGIRQAALLGAAPQPGRRTWRGPAGPAAWGCALRYRDG